MTKSLRCSLYSAWMVILLTAACLCGALAQGIGSNFIAGEIIVSFPAGTARATVNTVLNGVSYQVVKAFGPVDFERRWDVYYVRSTQTKPSIQSTNDAVVALKRDARVKFAGPNYKGEKDQGGVNPNDPLYGGMWGLKMMKMPQAWTLEKGKSNVVVTIFDTGVDIDHPDLKDHLTIGDPNTGPLNVVDPAAFTTNPRPTAVGEEHGTHVAGTAIGTTNNSIGIAGVVWEKSILMPVKGSLSEASDIAGWVEILRRAKARPDLRFVVNCSFNLGDSTDDIPPAPGTDPACDALLNLAKNGVIMMMSGGNRGSAGDTNPPRRIARMAAAHNNIFSVAAVGPTGQRASYSSYRPTNTIAAPGGEQTFDDDPNGILSTWWKLGSPAKEYYNIQGTSMAAPNMTGVCALLLSIPSVKTDEIKKVVTDTARRVGSTVPSPEYGYGIVDAYAALLKVAVAVTVVTPDGTGGKAAGRPGAPQPVETLRPEIKIAVNLIMPARLKIQVDGNAILPVGQAAAGDPAYSVENISTTTVDDDGVTVPFVYEAVIRNLEVPPGLHKVTVSGVKPGNPDITVSDTRNFTVQPKVLAAGRSMVSIPYYQEFGATDGTPLTPESYLGSDFRLARWVPGQDRYAFYSSFGVRDPYASFNPPDMTPRKDGETAPRYPIGIGFWSDVESAKPVLTRGRPLTDRPFIIPLKGNGTGSDRFISWNMVGDPFPFDVPFNAVLVDTPAGRISIQDAVSRGLVLPNIFSFDNENGYTYRSLPDGALRAWQGHWVGVTSRDDISLVVPPVSSLTRSATIGAPEPVVGGWTLRLSAHAKSLRDTFNFIGMSTKASDGYGLEDTPKPPVGAPYVSMGISHSDWGRSSGLYASDIRSNSGVKSWSVTVDTDQTTTDITLAWTGRALPRGQKVTIKDETSGQVVDMRTRSSLSFNSGATAGSRRFTITAKQGAPNQVRITNLLVRPSANRAAGTSQIGFTLTADATYEVNVLSGIGTKVARLTSRAASAGDVSLVWNGKDAGGRNVASGNYMVQIRATTADGDNVKVIYPFAIVR